MRRLVFITWPMLVMYNSSLNECSHLAVGITVLRCILYETGQGAIHLLGRYKNTYPILL